ncbi:hypothetical protein [Roseomonas sp. KE0001]|uniref:hypothetical protein n=1 Tax=Roseomonas sp. KE0001 TaxID=2479201 RepID=UPI0018DF203C|nr:hypothetical protein [Roseomonas sp. KE0001]MBI0433670.1 hypothetical protein [Roseomonas sp. KE0001]
MHAFLWFMSLVLLSVPVAMFVVLGILIADIAGRPVERMEGIVASRKWHAASVSLTTIAVVTPGGQVGTGVVPTADPEKYEVCLQLEDQRRCAAVRPAHFEMLPPGTRIAALARRGRLTGRIRIVRVLDRGEEAAPP